MITLCIRTDKPLAEIYVYKNSECAVQLQWEAHRSLAETLHTKIRLVLEDAQVTLADLDRVVIFRGPGSFTGLRIGMSVANALGYALNIPVIAAGGEGWLDSVLEKSESYFVPQIPVYGGDPHITQQKK